MPSSTTPTTPSIAIIGGGPAGLTLANLLLIQTPSITFTIFERRPRPTADDLINTPSGMLDLHPESGLAALRAANLYENFLPHSGETSEADVVTDHLANILHSHDGQYGPPGQERPEISRGALTAILQEGVPDDRIKWEHKLLAISQTPEGRTELDFGPSHGEKQSFDLVIGCDGAWSKVRNLLTDVKPSYAGQQYITATVRNVSDKDPRFNQFLGTGSLMALGKRNGILSHRNLARNTARLYVIVDAPGSREQGEKWAEDKGLTTEGVTAAEAGRKLVETEGMFKGWGEVLRDLVVAGCEDETKVWEETGKGETRGLLDVKPMYILPVGHVWKHRSGVTAIGDAAHLMGPWAGEGVNMAMQDALELSKVIAKGAQVGDLNSGVEAFEKEMSERCQEKAEEAARNSQIMFGSDEGGKALAQLFASFGPPPE